MLMELLLSFLRPRKRYTKDIVSFVHAALGPLFLVVFNVALTCLRESRELELRSTVLLMIFVLLVLAAPSSAHVVLVSDRVIDCSL